MNAAEFVSMFLMGLSITLLIGGSIFTAVEHSKHKKFMKRMNRQTRRLDVESGSGYIMIGDPRNNIAIITDFALQNGQVLFVAAMFAKADYKAGEVLGKMVLCGDDNKRIYVPPKPLVLDTDVAKGEKIDIKITMDFKPREYETWVRVP